MPPRAADHVAVVLRNEGLGGSREGRQTVTRSGSWIRQEHVEEGRPVIVHSDFASGTTFQYSPLPDGRYGSVWINRHASGDTRNLYQRIRTGRRERVLGEDCEIWNMRDAGEASGVPIDRLSCETSDGVQLWTRGESPNSPTIFSTSRTLSVTRRPIPAQTVRPPRDLLELNAWFQDAGPAAPASDHRVRLVLTSPPDNRPVRELIVQRHGALMLSDKRSADGSRTFLMQSPDAYFSYREDIGGEPVMLQIVRQPSARGSTGTESWVPREGRTPEVILGETCHWLRPRDLPHDSVDLECRAADGTPLIIEEWRRGHTSRYVAVELSRRPLSLADFALPARGLDWAAWGVARAPDHAR